MRSRNRQGTHIDKQPERGPDMPPIATGKTTPCKQAANHEMQLVSTLTGKPQNFRLQASSKQATENRSPAKQMITTPKNRLASKYHAPTYLHGNMPKPAPKTASHSIKTPVAIKTRNPAGYRRERQHPGIDITVVIALRQNPIRRNIDNPVYDRIVNG